LGDFSFDAHGDITENPVTIMRVAGGAPSRRIQGIEGGVIERVVRPRPSLVAGPVTQDPCRPDRRAQGSRPSGTRTRFLGDFLATRRGGFGLLEPNHGGRSSVYGTEGQRFESSRARNHETAIQSQIALEWRGRGPNRGPWVGTRVGTEMRGLHLARRPLVPTWTMATRLSESRVDHHGEPLP
jgi:hypothetical protein